MRNFVARLFRKYFIVRDVDEVKKNKGTVHCKQEIMDIGYPMKNTM